jgi:LytR cell envelope-related transcriptional attenuator
MDTNYPLMGLIKGYTCAGVFVATSLAVVLDMFNLIRLAPDIRNKLYTALVFEVVVIGVGYFASIMKFNPQTAKSQIANTAEQKVVDEQVKPLQQKVTQLETPVYLQIADESQRPAAKQLSEKLTALGFNVRGTENVGSKNAPTASEIRYFSGDEQLPIYAQNIANAMKAVGVSDVKIAPSKNKAFGGNIEVWFSGQVEPTLKDFAYAVAVNQDNSLKDALVHLREMLLDRKYPGSYILNRPGDGYRTVRLFKTQEEAMQFIPTAKEMNNTVEDKPKPIETWCPSPKWNKQEKYFQCTLSS